MQTRKARAGRATFVSEERTDRRWGRANGLLAAFQGTRARA